MEIKTHLNDLIKKFELWRLSNLKSTLSQNLSELKEAEKELKKFDDGSLSYFSVLKRISLLKRERESITRQDEVLSKYYVDVYGVLEYS